MMGEYDNSETGEGTVEENLEQGEEEQQWEGADPIYGPSTVIAALDQMEDLVVRARSVPLSANVLINRAELHDLIEQAREALPTDIVAADAVVSDADAVLSRADLVAEETVNEANAHAQATLNDARTHAQQFLADAQREAKEISSRSKDESHNIIEQARTKAQAIVSEAKTRADQYVSTDNITQMAQQRAHEILSQAKMQAQELHRGADDYTAKTLGDLSALLAEMQRKTEAGHRAVITRGGGKKTDIPLDHE